MDALEVINVKERTFRRWRDIAEALLVDETDFMALVERLHSPTLDDAGEDYPTEEFLQDDAEQPVSSWCFLETVEEEELIFL